MNNANLECALRDMVDAIRGVSLGSIESVVIADAGVSIISNWNDHNQDDLIDETAELENWSNNVKNDLHITLNVRPMPPCACGEHH